MAPSDGSSSGAVRLPTSFPTHEVPLLRGDLIVATGDEEEGWAVTLLPAAGDLKSAESQLESSGYSITRSTSNLIALSGPDYTVSIQSPGKTITYLVTER
jgi:hypothetical protein